MSTCLQDYRYKGSSSTKEQALMSSMRLTYQSGFVLLCDEGRCRANPSPSEVSPYTQFNFKVFLIVWIDDPVRLIAFSHLHTYLMLLCPSWSTSMPHWCNFARVRSYLSVYHLYWYVSSIFRGNIAFVCLDLPSKSYWDRIAGQDFIIIHEYLRYREYTLAWNVNWLSGIISAALIIPPTYAPTSVIWAPINQDHAYSWHQWLDRKLRRWGFQYCVDTFLTPLI